MNKFEGALDLIASTTGHHPLCVRMVGKGLADRLTETGHDDLTDLEFLLLLTDALTDGGICAGESMAEAFIEALRQTA